MAGGNILNSAVKRRLLRLALTAVVTLLALVVCELGLRTLRPEPLAVPSTSYVVQNDPDTDFIFKPNVRYYNAGLKALLFSNDLGLPDAPIPEGDPTGRRVLVLGDSMTWGAYTGDINKGFPRLLEERMRRPGSGPRVETRVINAGIPGYGTKQEVALYRKLAARLRAKVVVLSFFVGNDFVDNLGWTDHVVIHDHLVNRRQSSMVTPLLIKLYEHSYIHRFLASRIDALSFTRRRGEPYTQGMRFTFSRDERAAFEDSLVETARHLDQLIETTRTYEARLIVMLLPARLQIEEQARQDWIRRLKGDPPQFDLEKPNRAMARLLEQRQAQLVWRDLLPVFRREASTGASLFLPRDDHYSVQGNEVVAAEIENLLRGL